MEKSESIKSLATAMAKAQGEIENAGKNSVNPHFKSKYADLAEVLNTMRPVWSANGLAIMQFPSYHDGIASVETLISHSSGEWISSRASAQVGRPDAPGIGSATTYLRRYSAAAAAGIAQEDDDSNASIGKKPEPKSALDMIPDDKPNADLVYKFADSITVVKDALSGLTAKTLEGADLSAAVEAWNELDKEAKSAVWSAFSAPERAIMKTPEFKSQMEKV